MTGASHVVLFECENHAWMWVSLSACNRLARYEIVCD